jgi:hypothetical protein
MQEHFDMNGPTITCPNCQSEIKLTESFAAPLIQAARMQYEQASSQRESEIAKRETTVRSQQADLAKEKASIEEQVAARAEEMRKTIATQEEKKAKLIAAADLDQKAKEVADLQEVLKERDIKLAEARKAQADLVRKQRELDDAKREVDLTVEKRVQESLGPVREKAKQEAEESLNLRVLEKEELIASLRRQIGELKRKAEQGSQQLQGEVLELELESILRAEFPQDIIEPVPKGEFGGDVLHRVVSRQNQQCGTILWESKRTKNWSDAWLPKLRDDQRAANAKIALLVSNVLPKGTVAFNLVDGVWVTEARCALPVALVLRQSLIDLSAARHAADGQQTKMELVYEYLTGPQFRHRINAIVEKFSDMQADLDRERKTMTRLWAKREGQIRGVIESTAGMYGDLQGIAGKTLQEIDGLSLHLLEGPISTSEGADGPA